MRDISPEAIDQRAAEAVRTLRERDGMSQAGLAAEMAKRGIPWHQQTVGRIEAGRQSLRTAELHALAGIFGVAMERFTWSVGDANAMDWLDVAAERLRNCYADTAHAVTAQISAVRLAKRALEDTEKHTATRVLQARKIVQEAIEGWGDEVAALEEGRRIYAGLPEQDDEKGEGNGGDAESEPGLVDQRQA